MSLAKLESKVVEMKYGDAFLIHTETYNNKGGKTYTINIPMLREYLKSEGFRNFRGSPVLVQGNIFKEVTPEDIFKHTLEYVETFKESELESAFMKQGETILLKNKGVVFGLPECEKEELKDTEFISYHCYKNGIIKVEKEELIELITYKEAKGLVWEHKILNRNFVVYNESEADKAMFSQFLKKITIEEEHYLSLCSAIGYMLSKYKDQRKPICIIINDVNIKNDGKPEGGTGKGLLVKAVSKIVQKAIYNGKNSDFTNDKFAYQNVTPNTDLIFIDDAPRNFDFEALYSVLTDDMPVEKKHKPTIIIPYEESPKFVITTNYSIKGSTSSSKRRRFDALLTNHYSSEHSPADDFKCEFFHGWDEEEYSRFDFFMMGCLRYFLSMGLVQYENEDLRLKKLLNETSSDFYELMQEQFSQLETFYDYGSIRRKIIAECGDKYYFLEKDKKRVVKWVEKYAEFKNYEIMKKRIGVGISFRFKTI